MDIRVTRARRAFADGKHNAFTGIAAAYSRAFITFRSASTHLSPDGIIKVIASDDMDTWASVAEAQRPGMDLRDPKIVFFRGALMAFCAGCRPGDAVRESLVFRSFDGVTFDAPTPVRGIPAGHWLWHVRPLGDRLYGAAYCSRDGGYVVSLYASDDGRCWERVADFPVPGNEVYMDFDRAGILWALVRDDSFGCIPTLCAAGCSRPVNC